MVHFFLSIGILIVQDNLTAGMAGIELVNVSDNPLTETRKNTEKCKCCRLPRYFRQ